MRGPEYLTALLQPGSAGEPGPESRAREDGSYNPRFPGEGRGWMTTTTAVPVGVVNNKGGWFQAPCARRGLGPGWLEQGEGRVGVPAATWKVSAAWRPGLPFNYRLQVAGCSG